MTIAELADKADRARQYLISLGMRNTYGLTPEERADLSLEYKKAQIAERAASQALDDALTRLAQEQQA